MNEQAIEAPAAETESFKSQDVNSEIGLQESSLEESSLQENLPVENFSDNQGNQTSQSNQTSQIPNSGSPLILSAKPQLLESPPPKNSTLAKASLKIPAMILGKWEHPLYGTIEHTLDDFKKVITNFKKKILGYDVPLSFGHISYWETQEEGSLGFLEGLEIESSTLWAYFSSVRDIASQAVRDGFFRYSSAEIHPDYQDKINGKFHGPTLVGMALTNRPFIPNLPRVQAFSDVTFGDRVYYVLSNGDLSTSSSSSLKDKLGEKVMNFNQSSQNTATNSSNTNKTGDTKTDNNLNLPNDSTNQTEVQNLAESNPDQTSTQALHHVSPNSSEVTPKMDDKLIQQLSEQNKVLSEQNKVLSEQNKALSEQKVSLSEQLDAFKSQCSNLTEQLKATINLLTEQKNKQMQQVLSEKIDAINALTIPQDLKDKNIQLFSSGVLDAESEASILENLKMISEARKLQFSEVEGATSTKNSAEGNTHTKTNESNFIRSLSDIVEQNRRALQNLS